MSGVLSTTGHTRTTPGFARLATAIANASDAAIARGCTPILLDAGDQLVGTLWDKFYKGMTGVEFQNAVGVQAMTIGNHDFDHGMALLTNYTRTRR